MPISAQVSLWGIWKVDPTILDGLILPVGMDADTLKDNLLLETESMEILYPNAPFLKAAITVWSKERMEVWQKLYDSTLLEYNPLDNYDRYEESESKNNGENSGSTTATASSTAYNSNDFADVGKNYSSGSNKSSSAGDYKSHIWGNIGVTSSAQLLTQHRDVAQFCMTQFIIDDFISRFCVGVY